MRRPGMNRSAFTLTELLVVIALIVVLGALGMGAASKGYGWVKQRATETTMTKVLERTVQRRMTDIYKEAREWDTPDVIYQQATGDVRRAEVLKVLYLYKWSFPQTYSEAWFNYQESLALYDGANGYPLARAIYQRLFVNAGVPIAQFIATPAAAEMPRVLPLQCSACLVAAFSCFRASSLDEFGSDELSTPDATVGKSDLPGGGATKNRILVDAWGTPLVFLRHGNFWDNLGARAALNRAPFWMGLVNPPLAPVSSILGDQYYDILMSRAAKAFPSRWNTDPYDPEGLLRVSDSWRVVFAGTDKWLSPAAPAPYTTTHLALPAPGPTGSWQHQDYFRSNFGYRPQPSDLTNQPSWPQEYAPFVIISAGADKLFTTWDDNLDSYRLLINVSSQQ